MVQGVSDGGDLNTKAASALALSMGDAPEVEEPSDTFVRLPGGLVIDGQVFRTAEVRELTGEDEEAISKVRGNPTRLLNTLLSAGVVSIGDLPATKDLLGRITIGDREALLLGIRRATFGDTLSFEGYQCPNCGEFMDIDVSLDTVPTKQLETPERELYQIPLRKKNQFAYVRVPNGADQDAALGAEDLTNAQQNTLLLSRVIKYVHNAGTANDVPGGTKLAQTLGLADRQKILDWCTEIQPGPRYDEVKAVHPACETEVPLLVTMGILFRGLF